MKEKYRKWTPIDPVPFPLDFEDLHKNREGLNILLNSEDHTGKLLNIKFKDYITIREMDESFKTKFWHDVDIDENYPFFIVEDSEWLAWFHNQSMDNFKDWDIKHFAIWTTENWIDILSRTEPIVTWKEI